jgi:adenosylmethionine-8-amino-7-oxononanoate aminotransferase
MTNNISIVERDQKYIWHPFTQHGLDKECLSVSSAKGAWLTLEDGRKILDAISSWWVTLHGHAQPEIAEAIFKQANQLEQVIFARFTHEPAVTLAETLIHAAQKSGAELTRCFYSDNGSTAVEAAMKISYQYHKNHDVNTRTRFIALENSYHGDTLGAMSLSARGSYHQHFSALLSAVDFISTDEAGIKQLEKYLNDSPEQYAALIVEPMVQGAGGMKMHSPDFLSAVAALCQKSGVLLICDEVFTGFYRTGKCFAFEHATIKPDLLCLGKGLSGGFLPLSATLATEEIFNAFQSKQMHRAFLHGHSFTANPLACAAAIASWDILQKENTQTSIKNISHQTEKWIKRLSTHKNCAAARSLGTIGAIEMRGLPDYLSSNAYKIFSYAIKKGVLIRPMGSIIYTVPPYCTNEIELDKIYEVIESILNEAF